MNAPRLQLVRSREQVIEDCLSALIAVIGDTSFPLHVREDAAKAHASLHACRSPQTVRRMERDMGIGTGGGAA